MSRIPLIDRASTTPERQVLLNDIHGAFGATPNPTTQAALHFALKLVNERGQVSEADVHALRGASSFHTASV